MAQIMDASAFLRKELPRAREQSSVFDRAVSRLVRFAGHQLRVPGSRVVLLQECLEAALRACHRHAAGVI